MAIYTTRQVNSMQNERIDSYRQSMESIRFSDHEKESMVRRIMNGEPENGGRMKSKLDFRKIALTAAACVVFLSATALAAGAVTSITSWNRPDTRTTNFEDLSQIEEKSGIDVTAIDSFSNGYSFDYMEVEELTTQDDAGNDIASYKGISMEYTKEGSPDLYLSMDPTEAFGESSDESATAVKEYEGIKLYYNYDEYLSLPVDEEPTEEERLREETDNHFFISDGSDERCTDYVSSVIFDIDGITYCLMSFDTSMTADDFFQMAEEIITAR